MLCVALLGLARLRLHGRDSLHSPQHGACRTGPSTLSTLSNPCGHAVSLCCLLHAASGLLHSLHRVFVACFRLDLALDLAWCVASMLYILPLKCWDLSGTEPFFTNKCCCVLFLQRLFNATRATLCPTHLRGFEPSALDAPLDRPCHHSAVPYSTLSITRHCGHCERRRTLPPCTEGVEWFVLAGVLPAFKEQVRDRLPSTVSH